MFANLAIDKMFSQMITNVLSAVVNEEIDNPYLKAALGPIIETFSQGILNGSSPEAVGQSAYEAVQKLPAEAIAGPIAQALPEDYARLYASNLLQQSSVPNTGLLAS